MEPSGEDGLAPAVITMAPSLGNGSRTADIDPDDQVGARIAVISDIHSNLHALEAVLEAIDGLEPPVSEIVCVGDVVGYNAFPEESVDLVRERVHATVLGNHDWAATEGSPEGFNHMGSAGVRYTKQEIDDDAREFVADFPLKAQGTVAGVTLELVHGAPDDPISRYVFPPEGPTLLAEAARERRDTAPHVLFLGHTHVPMGYVDPGLKPGEDEPEDRPGRVPARIRQAESLQKSRSPLTAAMKGADDVPEGPEGEPQEQTTLSIDGPAPVALVNPGSVGQPRDGDPRASFAVLDAGERTVTWYRVPYDVDAAREAVIDAGLPRRIGDRLLTGY